MTMKSRQKKIKDQRRWLRRRGLVTNLHVVHLVLAHDFDSDVAVLALQVAGSVDVAEGAVAHLLDELPSLEARIVGKLGLAATSLARLASSTLRLSRFLLGCLSRSLARARPGSEFDVTFSALRSSALRASSSGLARACLPEGESVSFGEDWQRPVVAVLALAFAGRRELVAGAYRGG